MAKAEGETGSISGATPTTGDLSDPAQYLITTRYIDGLKDMAKSENARVIFMPVQTSRVLGSAGAIKEVLSTVREQA